MEKRVGKFSENLKESDNIAIIADTTKGLDSLCAAIGIKELVESFLNTSESVSASVYFLSSLPVGADALSDKVKIFNKIGEKTLNIIFPTEKIEKIVYNFDEKNKEFKLSLLGFKNTTKDTKKVKYEEETEKFDMVVGVGFEDEKDLLDKVPYSKNIKSNFIFNEKNLKSKSLTEGVIDLYFKEKVKPSKLASLAFFTALNYSD